MKILNEKYQPKYKFFDLQSLFNEAYQSNVSICLNDKCIEKIEIHFQDGKPIRYDVTYNKAQVTHPNGVTGYWPIESHTAEYDTESAGEFLKKVYK